MRKSVYWATALVGVAGLLAGPTPKVDGGDDTVGQVTTNYATFLRRTDFPRFGYPNPGYATLDPGQIFHFLASTSERLGSPGWSSTAKITFSKSLAFVETGTRTRFPQEEITSTSITVTDQPGGGGIYLDMPFKVKPVDQLDGEIEARIRVDLAVTTDDGQVCTDSIELAAPIVGLPLGVSVNASTPRPGFARPGDEVLWRLVASPGSLLDRLTVENPLPDRKVGMLVEGSASPPAAIQGGKLVWTFDDVNSPQTVTFRVKLADRLPKKLKQISNTATATASDGKSKSTTGEVPVARATLVAGEVRDAVLDFPDRINVQLRPPSPPTGAGREVMARLLKKSDGNEIDAVEVDKNGTYALDAAESGDYVVEISTHVDRYSAATNTVDEGVAKLVQKREVTVPSAAANPDGDPVEVDTILLPVSLANGLAQRLLRLNNMAPVFSGFVPLPTTLDTGDIPDQLDALLVDADEAFEEVYDGTGERDGWNAAIRLDAVLSIVERRFIDNAKLADVFSKSVSLLVTIEVMKKLGPKIVDRWKAANGNPKFPPADMKSRTIEAVKIATLAYGVGYLLPKLLEQTDLSPAEKSLLIETVAKAVRFGLNTFVAAQNGQDVVFEAIFQIMRVAIFAGFNEVIFVAAAERELARASGLFANRTIGDDTTQTLAWLALYDDRVGDRSNENFRIAGDALKKLSLFVRGLDGVLFKAQQAMGYSSSPKISGTLRDGTSKLLTFLKKPKDAATITAFALAVAAPLAEQGFLYQDMEVEVGAAFLGSSGLGPPEPPGEGLATSSKKALDEFASLFDPGFYPDSDGSPKRSDPPAAPPIAEVAAYLLTLESVASSVDAGDVPAYEAARTTMLASHDPFFSRLRTAAEQALAVVKDDPSAPDVLVGVQGARYETGNSVALCYQDLEVWAAEPTGPNAKSALTSISDLRTVLADVSGPVVGAETALAARQVPAVLVVSGGPDGEDLAANAAMMLTFTVRNVGSATSEISTARLEVTDAFTIVGSPDAGVPALPPGASTTIEFAVTTANARRGGSYVLLIEQPDGTFVPLDGFVTIVP